MKADSSGGHKTGITNTGTEFNSSQFQYIQKRKKKGVKTVKASGQLQTVQSEKNSKSRFQVGISQVGIPQLPYFTFLSNSMGHQDPSHQQVPVKQQDKHEAGELQHCQKDAESCLSLEKAQQVVFRVCEVWRKLSVSIF